MRVCACRFVQALRVRLSFKGPLTVMRGAFRILGGADDGKIDVDELSVHATTDPKPPY